MQVGSLQNIQSFLEQLLKWFYIKHELCCNFSNSNIGTYIGTNAKPAVVKKSALQISD
jgi:hypothetical protein